MLIFLAQLIASTSKAGDRFGSSVGVYASNVIAGAPGSTSVAYSGQIKTMNIFNSQFSIRHRLSIYRKYYRCANAGSIKI